MGLLILIVGIIVSISAIAILFNRPSGGYYDQSPYSDHYPDDYSHHQRHHPGSPYQPYYPPQYPQGYYDPYHEQREREREYYLRRYHERLEYNRNIRLVLALVFGLGILATFFRHQLVSYFNQQPRERPPERGAPSQELPQAEAPPYNPTSSNSHRQEYNQEEPAMETIEEKVSINRDRSTLPIYLQASSSRFAHEATRSMRECQELGLSCIRRKVQENGRVWYRVYVGPFETVEEAGELKIALGESGWKVVRVE